NYDSLFWRSWYASVLFGNGDGTLQPPQQLYVGSVISVAVGDFNGDGAADFVAANFAIGEAVSVVLGRGDGTFRAAPSFPVGRYLRAIALGDFNQDGISDVAVSYYDYYSSHVSVLLGVGDGTFRQARNFEAGGPANDLAVADFNGDGLPDLAVAIDRFQGSVSILLGDGDGTFQPARSFAVPGYARALGVADFNGDGAPDIVLLTLSFSTTSQVAVAMLLGRGDGNFEPPLIFPVDRGSGSIAVADFDGDGLPDVAVGGGTAETGTVMVLFGRGDGTFQYGQSLLVGEAPTCLAVGDFNRDGAWDLAMAFGRGAPGIDNGVTVLLGNGDGTFQQPQEMSFGAIPSSIAVNDFNGDGVPDLAVANSASDSVSVLLGNGDGSFQPPMYFGTESFPISIAAGDLNSDGRPDLVV